MAQTVHGRNGCTGLWLGIVWLGAVLGVPNAVSGDVFHHYGIVETFTLPMGAGPMTVMPDGRVLTIVDAELFAETAPGSRSFDSRGVLPAADIPFFGAAFVAVSPDQARVAVGNNGGSTFSNFRVGVFTLDTLSGDWFPVNHFLATWLDNTRLVITAGDFLAGSWVSVLDATSPDPNNPIHMIIVDNIGGASGGIAFDAEGNLYTANGFATIGPSGTGAIRAFAQADWSAVLSGGEALDFEASGAPILDILSGAPLGFDADGNLFAGGGADPPESDFLAIAHWPDVRDAAAGMGPIDPGDGLRVRRLDPDAKSASNRYSAAFNPARGELYVRDTAQPTVYVYAEFAGVPAVSAWGLVLLTVLTATAGTLVLRSRSRAFVADSVA